MYGIIGQLTAKRGKRDELAGILSGIARNMAGCLSYVIAEDQDDESSLWVTEIWESKEAHENSLSEPDVRAAIEQGRPLIAGMGERIVTRPIGGQNSPLAGYTALVPYLLIPGAHDALAFYSKVFGARELMRIDDSSGRVVHAELGIDETVVMIGDPAGPEADTPSDTCAAGMTQLFLFVDDCDEVIRGASAAGATVVEAPATRRAEGLRRGPVRDPFGIVWWVATRTEAVSREEVMRRFRET
jgi:uncharacterized glyoxalase superfamily protein PhnB/quinol monooxygenase YgiN